jgi:hypothetical protein
MKKALEADTRKWVMLQQLRGRAPGIKLLRGGHPNPLAHFAVMPERVRFGHVLVARLR